LLEGKPVAERFGMLTAIAPVVTRVPLTLSLAELGELAEAIAQGEEVVRIAETVGQPFSMVIAYLSLSHAYVVKGNLERAIPMLVRSLDICRNTQISIYLSWATAELGYAYLFSSRVTEALPLLERAVNQSKEGLRDVLHRCWLGEAYLLTSQTEKAGAVARHALDLARDNKERGNEAYALRLLGEIAAHKDPPDVREAEDHYRQALALAEELGMRPLVAHCNVGLGKLYQRTDDLRLAKEHINHGVAMMRDMQMGLWLEKAEVELKELG
jgi:tetratricopeptide (TPR) repeat protein